MSSTSGIRWFIVGVACALVGRGVWAQQGAIRDRLPEKIDPAARYLIYLHGRIIEEKGRRPTDSNWGVYEYDKVLQALARDGAVVVSEQRPSGTDMDRFAAHVAEQVHELLRRGVPPEQIAVVGFSKGGGIAIRTSALLQNPRVDFVFLAACGDGDFSRSPLKVSGRILSIFEESDDVGRSCKGLFAKSPSSGERSEIEIHVGEHHGTFYRPHEEWLRPVLGWVRHKAANER
jgi:dienelactone hydrolase